MKSPNPTDKYKFCNHHHELTEDHTIVDFGDGPFVANKKAVPLLKALNELGLRTRTHHVDGVNYGFFSILLDDGIDVSIRTVNEKDADRVRYNGKKEMLISWYRGEEKCTN